MLVTERFSLDRTLIQSIIDSNEISFGFNGLGDYVFHRSYSRQGESWPDTVERVVNGILSIRKNHYIRNGLEWDSLSWHQLGARLFYNIYTMKFLPPGRGLWAMGTDHVYEVGAMALYNCAGTKVTDETFAHDLEWSMDAMMLGCGVGYRLFTTDELRISLKRKFERISYQTEKHINMQVNAHYKNIDFIGNDIRINDNREGWVESVHYMLSSGDISTPFDYSLIRPYGSPLKRFGGESSGPAPLMILHTRLRAYIELYISEKLDTTTFVANCINAIGCCVVSGNIRRGAQILVGSPKDKTFIKLKSHEENKASKEITSLITSCTKLSKQGRESYSSIVEVIESLREDNIEVFLSDRPNISYLSNNSVILEQTNDFLALREIANQIRKNGEPGIINAINTREFGRIRPGDNSAEPDNAIVFNPCGEIPLEDKEVCNVVEVFPTLCNDNEERIEAIKLATFYAQTVSLLPTHQPETNKVVARNRRIGISKTGVAEWLSNIGSFSYIRLSRDDYGVVKKTAHFYAKEAGVPDPIRLTTMKPAGSVSLLVGVSSGIHYPTFPYAIRRIRVAADSPIDLVMSGSGIKPETSLKEPGTHIYSFPIEQSKARPATSVSAWEQFALLATTQREWSDNAVSCTIYFDPETEGDQIEFMLGHFVPLIKSVSMLPHTPAGTYELMPYEGIIKERYEEEIKKLKPIDWNLYREKQKSAPLSSPDSSILFCDNDICATE